MADLNLSWISPLLAVGGRFAADELPQLADALAVRHVVDVRMESRDDLSLLRAHGIELLHLPARDNEAVASELIRMGVRWVVSRVESGGKVLVHCEHGIGRSVLVALCVLVELGERPREALLRIKRARPCASPSPAQLEAFLEFCRERGSPQALPGWHDLAEIAYRGAGVMELPPR